MNGPSFNPLQGGSVQGTGASIPEIENDNNIGGDVPQLQPRQSSDSAVGSGSDIPQDQHPEVNDPSGDNVELRRNSESSSLSGPQQGGSANGSPALDPELAALDALDLNMDMFGDISTLNDNDAFQKAPLENESNLVITEDKRAGKNKKDDANAGINGIFGIDQHIQVDKDVIPNSKMETHLSNMDLQIPERETQPLQTLHDKSEALFNISQGGPKALLDHYDYGDDFTPNITTFIADKAELSSKKGTWQYDKTTKILEKSDGTQYYGSYTARKANVDITGIGVMTSENSNIACTECGYFVDGKLQVGQQILVDYNDDKPTVSISQGKFDGRGRLEGPGKREISNPDAGTVKLESGRYKADSLENGLQRVIYECGDVYDNNGDFYGTELINGDRHITRSDNTNVVVNVKQSVVSLQESNDDAAMSNYIWALTNADTRDMSEPQSVLTQSIEAFENMKKYENVDDELMPKSLYTKMTEDTKKQFIEQQKQDPVAITMSCFGHRTIAVAHDDKIFMCNAGLGAINPNKENGTCQPVKVFEYDEKTFEQTINFLNDQNYNDYNDGDIKKWKHIYDRIEQLSDSSTKTDNFGKAATAYNEAFKATDYPSQRTGNCQTHNARIAVLATSVIAEQQKVNTDEYADFAREGIENFNNKADEKSALKTLLNNYAEKTELNSTNAHRKLRQDQHFDWYFSPAENYKQLADLPDKYDMVQSLIDNGQVK